MLAERSLLFREVGDVLAGGFLPNLVGLVVEVLDFCPELVEQRFGLVVVDDAEGFAAVERLEGVVDQRVSFRWRDLAQVACVCRHRVPIGAPKATDLSRTGSGVATTPVETAGPDHPRGSGQLRGGAWKAI